jgi:uncharacterized protein with HEPN domain
MDRRTAKDLLHIRDWLDRVELILQAGRDAYDADPLTREAGDALMMKIGEAASRLSKRGVVPPVGVSWADGITNRNWLIHQYDMIDRGITQVTLAEGQSPASLTICLRAATCPAKAARPAGVKAIQVRRGAFVTAT